METLQILRALTFDDYGWRNHPAVTMWSGCTEALVTYGIAVTQQWQAAGFADTVGPQLVEFLGRQPLRSQRELRDGGLLPAWLGSRPLHRSHQAALVRKDPGRYRALFPKVDAELPYVWPDAAPQARDEEPVSGWVVRVAPHEMPGAPFELHHTRRVRWITAVHRTDLRRPVHLQDPRIVFPLRGEPLLSEVD